MRIPLKGSIRIGLLQRIYTNGVGKGMYEGSIKELYKGY